MDNRIKLLYGEFYGPVAASYPASGNLGMNNENICPFGVMANASESHHFLGGKTLFLSLYCNHFVCLKI